MEKSLQKHYNPIFHPFFPRHKAQWLKPKPKKQKSAHHGGLTTSSKNVMLYVLLPT